jgi:DNA-binding transcriptional regulator YiaG
MPNLSQVIKAEIARISRREIKTSTNPLRASTVALKKSAADLKKRVAVIEAETKRLVAFYTRLQTERQAQAPHASDSKTRITSKGIRALRNKLGLSQESFARLLGVSSQAVYIMEHKNGRLSLRSGTLASLLSIRGIGRREARAKLAEKESASTTARGKRKKK